MKPGVILILIGWAVALASGAADETPFYPKLEFSIHPAGKNSVEGMGIALDAAGNIYVTGTTRKAEVPGDFPAAGGIPPSTTDGLKVFIGKLDPTATRWIYATYLGWAGDEIPTGIAVDRVGNAYVAGYNGGDGFVYKINAAGSAIVYKRLLGGRAKDGANGIAVDGAGNAYVIGYTGSPDFPTTRGALKTTLAPADGDAFVVKLNASGENVYSTYLGGSRDDEATAIAVDETGSAYVAGRTQSADFPATPGAFQTAVGTKPGAASVQDGFVVKLNPSGSALTAATFLGGTRSDGVSALALDAAGMVYVGGYTDSFDFPVKNAYQSSLAVPPGWDPIVNGFFAKLNPQLSELVYSTFLDGMTAGPSGLTADHQGHLFAVGTAEAGTAVRLPMKHAFQGAPFLSGCFIDQVTTRRSCVGTYLLALSAYGSELLYSTYVGGENRRGRAVAIDDQGNAYVTGGGASRFPVVGSYPVESGYLYVAKVGRGAVPAPYTSAASIVNSASFQVPTSPASPGMLVTIFGKNLTSTSGVAVPEGYPLPTELEGAQVIYNGIPAPILAVANQNGVEQINVQIPYGSTLWDGTPAVCCGIEIRSRGVSGYAPQPPNVISSQNAGIFTVDGRPAVQRAVDYSLVTEDNPARRGEVITIYATGLGKVEPPVASGMPASEAPLSNTACPYEVWFGYPGPAIVEALFAGLTPGLVGVYQVNVRVPESLSAGRTQLRLSDGICRSGTSSPFVAIPVR